MTRRGRRLRRASLVALSLWTVYLVAANALLRTEAGRERINRRPERWQVTWSDAWTAVPGLVHVEDLAVRSRTARWAWEARLESGTAWVVLPLLAIRRFDVRGLSGRGLRFRAGRTDRALAPGDPDVPGFVGELPPKRPRRRGFAIGLGIGRVEGVREIRIRETRLTGVRSLSGRLDVRLPGPVVAARDVDVVLENAEIRRGEGGFAEFDGGRLTGDLEPFVPREHGGRAALRFVSGELELASGRTDLQGLGLLWRDVEWIDLDGAGSLEARLRCEDGRLIGGSSVRADADLEAGILDWTVRGDGKVRAEVAGEGRGPLELSMELEDFELQSREAASPHAMGPRAVVEIRTPDPDLAGVQGEIQVGLRIAAARVPDLTYYNRYLPEESSLRIVRGSGRISSSLEAGNRPPSLTGSVDVTGDEVVAELDGLEMEGDLGIATRIVDGDPTARRFALDGTRIELRDAAIRRDGEPQTPDGWWGELEIPDGEARLRKPIELEGSLRARLRDTSPFVVWFGRDRRSPGWIRKALTVEGVEGEAEVVYVGDATEIRDLELVVGDHLALSGELSLSRADPRALLFLRYRKLTAAVDVEGRERDWDLVRSRRWFDDRRRGWADPLAPP